MFKLWLKIKYFLGWRDCTNCGNFVKIKWIKDWILYEDEPSMFGHWECSKCKASTETQPTRITEDVVKKLGFKNFNHFMEKYEG